MKAHLFPKIDEGHFCLYAACLQVRCLGKFGPRNAFKSSYNLIFSKIFLLESYNTCHLSIFIAKF